MPGKIPFYITTAISYVNGAPHLGHAYEAISTDVIARFKRLEGYRVHFLTGTDEHGQKVEKTARDYGEDTAKFCNRIAEEFKNMTGLLNISNDDFIRTTEVRHIAASQAIWTNIMAAGDIYLGRYAGWYAVRDEAYYGEGELVKNDLGNLVAPTGAEVEWMEEPSYFFRLSKYSEKLLKFYEHNPDFILPKSRRNEVINFVRQGLQDLSISRTGISWGVPVPGDSEHVMYVWLDALTNYVTGVGYPDTKCAMFKSFWPADLHIIGKDIVRFHAIYWPAFLMAAGISPPKKVFGHGFLNVAGEKMSKSLGNVTTPKAMIEEFGLDQVRYFLMREVPYGGDGSFTKKSLINRINADLANDLGNLAQRVLTQIHRYCDARVPQPGNLSVEDETMIRSSEVALSEMQLAMENQEIHRMLEVIWSVVGMANRYVDAQAPWALRKNNPTRMKTVLYILVNVVRVLGIYVQSVIPDSASTILEQVSVPMNKRLFIHVKDNLNPGTVLPKPSPIFPRYVGNEENHGDVS